MLVIRNNVITIKKGKGIEMDTTLKFDKVILTKELNDKFKKVGEIYEVSSILDKAFLLKDVETKIAVGVVSYEDFEKYFVKIEGFKGWTPWTMFVGFNGQCDCMYRTNGKKVQVKFLTDKVRAEACCNKEDDFNLSFGIQIAYLRCLNKVLAKRKAEYEDVLKYVNSEITDNEHIIRKMINSLV